MSKEFTKEQTTQYVDVEAALKRIRDNRKILSSLLQSFAKNTYLEQLQKEIEANDLASAAKTAHAIKGVAANLSLIPLYNLTILLETELKSEYYGQDTFLEFKTVYEKTISSINQVIMTL